MVKGKAKIKVIVPEFEEENLGNIDPNYVPEYDYLKIRRRCENEMRAMDDKPLLLAIAKMLSVKLT
jgi:hypothetical protein